MAETLAERMAALAADAVTLTSTYFLEELDFTPQSVDVLERLAADVRYSMPGGDSPSNRTLLARAWGAYLGEVLRRACGGGWAQPAGPDGELAVVCGAVVAYPLARVFDRLGKNGPAYDLREYLRQYSDGIAATPP